ncbi:uncharacterized protein [Amphiura filiformis]|uniref:uncharacterized protein isoform X2 n=1 Tax=Amphiura filiformis TaxID=82378 RepID=UPI003B226583
MTKIQVFLHILVIIVSALATCICEDTNGASEFVFSIPFLSNIVSPPHVLITTSSLVPIFTTLTIPGGGYNVTNTISRDNPLDIRLSMNEVRLTNSGVQERTIFVRSSGESLVFVVDNENKDGDTYLVYSTSQLGTQYYVASYKPYDTRFPSFLCISSIYPNTSINITTPAGKTVQIILKRHESYRFDSDEGEDLSGTFVQSNKPIAVISGVITYVPDEKVCCLDGLIEQLPPVHSWGYKFTFTPFLSLNSGYVYRVFTTIYSATLYMSDGNITHIAAESFHEEDVTENTVVSFTSDQPVMAVQYMKGSNANTPDRGDPSMLSVTPNTAFTAEVTFPVIEYTGGLYTYYINVILECDYVMDDGVLLDGTHFMSSDSLSSSDNSMCCLRSNVSIGHHTVSHTHPMARFAVIVYAIGADSSYAYAANAYGAGGCLPAMIIHSDEGSVVPAKNVYAYGDVITVYCREGFHRIGDEQLSCLNTGSWLGEIPKCFTDDQKGTTVTELPDSYTPPDDSSCMSSIIIALGGVGVALGVVTIAIILAAIVVYCKRKRKPEQCLSTYTTPDVQNQTNLVEDQYEDAGVEIPLDKERKHEQEPYAYSTYTKPNVQDPTNPVEGQCEETGVEIPLDKERKPGQGLSGYSTYIPPDEQDPTNSTEDQCKDTGIEIPLDNMGYATIRADRDIPNYLEVYADIPNKGEPNGTRM